MGLPRVKAREERRTFSNSSFCQILLCILSLLIPFVSYVRTFAMVRRKASKITAPAAARAQAPPPAPKSKSESVLKSGCKSATSKPSTKRQKLSGKDRNSLRRLQESGCPSTSVTCKNFEMATHGRRKARLQITPAMVWEFYHKRPAVKEELAEKQRAKALQEKPITKPTAKKRKLSSKVCKICGEEGYGSDTGCCDEK